MKDPFNMITCGVGGQGVVRMSNVIGEACARTGLNVLSGELHGLSQRSGSVVIHQRIGKRAISPLVPYGEADVILALEPMEALRYIHFLRPGGTVITNTALTHPPGETSELARKEIDGYVSYDEVVQNIREMGDLIEIDALDLAIEAGNALVVNTVMVGAMTALPDFPVEAEEVRKAIEVSVPKGAVDANLKGFDLGIKAVNE